MGQYIQEGPRNMFETVLNIELSYRDITIEADPIDDGLDYLKGKTIDFINEQAFRGTLAAHTEGGVPNLIFNIPVLSTYYLGKLLFTFEVACAASGYLLEVNPFDQPGVEAYKTKMNNLIQNS
jgi:glucose-6-phosphate isomerase